MTADCQGRSENQSIPTCRVSVYAMPGAVEENTTVVHQEKYYIQHT
jgi:hypothetical protein